MFGDQDSENAKYDDFVNEEMLEGDNQIQASESFDVLKSKFDIKKIMAEFIIK